MVLVGLGMIYYLVRVFPMIDIRVLLGKTIMVEDGLYSCELAMTMSR